MKMIEHYFKIADQIEYGAGHPFGMLFFLAWSGGMPLLNIDVANYGISVMTAAMLFLTVGSARRDRKAIHVKLDDLETNIECATTENSRLEELTEEEIEKRRD